MELAWYHGGMTEPHTTPESRSAPMKHVRKPEKPSQVFWEALLKGDVLTTQAIAPEITPDILNHGLQKAAGMGWCDMIEALLNDPRCDLGQSQHIALRCAVDRSQAGALNLMLTHLNPASHQMPGNVLIQAIKAERESLTMIEALLPFWDRVEKHGSPLAAAASINNEPAIARLIRESDVQAAARHLVIEAKSPAGSKKNSNVWLPLENLAMHVATEVARPWVDAHGAQNFPRWLAHTRTLRALNEILIPIPSRSRSRP